MPKKNKKQASHERKTAGNSRLDVPSDAYLPFENIKEVKPEQLKPETSKPQKQNGERKEPLVLGYDPHANFADILQTWEETGELGGVTKRMKSHSGVQVQKSFADILNDWEAEKGKAIQQKKDPQQVKKSPAYVPSKDFGSLLDQFDGTPKETIKPKKIIAKQIPEKAVRPIHPSKEMEEALEEKDILDAERESPVQWSFAETYRKWNSVRDEKQAIQEARKDKQEEKKVEPTLSELRAMLPEATLDLHGMKVLEAEKACADFLLESSEKKLIKVAVITGKGLHNDKGYSLLKEAALSQIRLSKVVRQAYTPKACHGGSGVIWILLKR